MDAVSLAAVLDILSRGSATGALILMVWALMTERLVPRSRLESAEEDAEQERADAERERADAEEHMRLMAEDRDRIRRDRDRLRRDLEVCARRHGERDRADRQRSS